MGRNKNRNKLQLKSPSQLRNESFSRNNSFNESEMYDNENNFESSENILNNPILLNHINEIQNINESVLIWSNEDVIDENRSKSFHSIVKQEIIKKSIKKSAFSKYLKSQLKDINTIHLSAISGVLMKNEMESDKSSVILNEIPNNNYLKIETKKQSVDNKNSFELPEEIENVDANRRQVSLQETCASPNEPVVRRSGRSAKINYKDMLNIHIYEPVRLTDDWHSPKRKHKVKREPSRPSIRQSTSDNSEVDNRSPERKLIEQKVEFTESEEEKHEGKCTIEHEAQTGYEIKEKEEDKPSQFEIDEERQKHQGVDSDNSHKPNHYQVEENKSNIKRKAFRKPTKDLSRNCIMCSKAVMGSRKFDNLCYNCVVAATKIITRLKLCNNDTRPIVCLGDCGCWERITDFAERTDILPCDACKIQQLMASGLQWGEQLQWMRTVTLDELRSHEAVQRSRQLQLDQGQAWLNQLTGIEHFGSCLLPDTDLTHAYKWDIRYLVPLGPDGKARCQFCALSHDSDVERSPILEQLYTILPLKETTICQHCLMMAHNAIRNSGLPADGLLQQIRSICPLEPLRYRYFDGAANPDGLCEICMRKDNSVMSRLRSGNLVCLICIWRIKRVHFRSASGDTGADDGKDRIDNHEYSCYQQKDQWVLCPINQCDCCLKQLAIRVIELHQIITHYHNPTQLSVHRKPSNIGTSESNRKPKKRTIEHCEESKPKRQCTMTTNPLSIDANWTPIQATSDGQRPRRVIKSTRYNDFIVDDKCLLKSTNERSVKRKSGHIPAQISPTKSYDSKSLLSTGENEQHRIFSPDESTHDDMVQKEEEKPIVDDVLVSTSCENVGIADQIVAGESDSGGDSSHGNQEIKCDNALNIANTSQEELIEHTPTINTDDCTPRRPPQFRRIKQAISTQASKPTELATEEEEIMNQHEESATFVDKEQPVINAHQTARATSGPRVKQVSRQNLNVDTNIDSTTRQKCVVKRTNRIVKKPETLTNYIIDDHSITDQMEDDDEDHHLDQLSTGRCDSIPLERQSVTGWEGGRCGICAGCNRNRSCGKCDPCLLNKSQRRKTELCVKMICTARTQTTNQINHIGTKRDKISDIRNTTEVNTLNEASTTDKSVDEITPGTDVSTVCQQLCNGIDVYRDSDSDDLSSEEEQLDPELDSIHTVKGDLITTGLAHEGGFPVITTVNAQPNKVLCYSCGSGGDQLIHCVSCAEPFHFFCIEYQFRPKSKEMFVCRNCTKCHSCDVYGSDLKCIKCQLGFHPTCVDKYPPTRSDDKSNWACYKCAMCLHCGAKAEDAMTHHNTNKFSGEIDWSKDPWQCGRCARARINGHVCPECGRAYQAGLETIECNSCNRMVHRQCCGLSEDEYEIFKADPEAHCSSNAFLCTKCQPPDVAEETEQKKRVRLKRQCKDSGLKQYCERSVQRKTNEFIQKGEAAEEMLLEQHNVSDSAATGYNKGSMSLSQYDGHDDEDDEDKIGGNGGLMSVKDYEGLAMNSPSADMNQTSSTMFCSSESTGECDMDPLNLMDLEHQSVKVDIDVELENIEFESSRATKIGIFSRLNAPDFLSPKHLLMEALARICVKLSRYPSHSQLHKVYERFIGRIEDLTQEIFPWIDFNITMATVQMVVKKYSGRAKLIMQALAENVRDNINREFDVFSSSITEIEEKLSNSFQRGREEFIIFHSEQHLSALMKSIEFQYDADSTSTATYNVAFPSEFNSTICEKDIRHCALCAGSGDDRLEGRLIYGGLDVWVHVNCALWSDDVYEREDGALVNVDIAIRKGEKALCAACQKYGATLRCSAPDSLDGCGSSCPNVYHFACAFNMLPDPVFTELRTFYCSESHDNCVTDVLQLTLVDMPILRRIYLPQGCLANVSMACTDGVASDNIVVTIGNLRINCMGKIDECSDYLRVYLCPIGYQARRLFWSMYELDSLVMYYMNVTKELNNKANGDDLSVSASGVVNQNPATLVAAAAIPHRRRMIEMPEQRTTKRSKPMQCKQDIIYEMDEAGNLQPISGFFRSRQPAVATTVFNKVSNNEIAAKKVNRRFPISIASSRVGIVQQSSLNSLSGTEENHRIVPLRRPENINQNTNNIINNCSSSSIIIKSHPASHASQQPYQPQPLSVPRVHQQQQQQQSISQSQMPIIMKQQDPPVMLRLNKIQPQRLPPSIVKQLNINQNQSKPLTFIHFGQPINRISVKNPPMNNKIFKVMKVATSSSLSPATVGVGNSSTSIPISPLTTATKHPSLRIVTSRPPLSSSVLRTVLTDNSHSRRVVVHQQTQPALTIGTSKSSAYHISSCGSIITPSLAQFDGEGDDGSAVTFDEFRSILAAHPAHNVGSDQENASVITMATTTTVAGVKTRKQRANHDYKFCLRFTIHGFKGSKSPKSGWGLIVKRITQMRKSQGLMEYPVRNGDGWAKFGLDHRHVIYLVEQMVSAFQCNNYEFKFHKTRVTKLRNQYLADVVSPHGCVRFNQWTKTKPDHIARDPLAFLHSKSNYPPKNHAPLNADQLDDNPDPDEDYLRTLADQFRNLRNGMDARAKTVRVCVSNIHGRGLFARRQFDAHEIIIEYVGEVIRSILSDVRETEYQRTGVDCYMFRLDQDLIVDATFKGNAARFINHSCHPNCYAKVVRFEGEKHIIIIAQRKIYKGEELTYDYRFPIEDDKLPCTCGSFSCKKYLN